MDGTFAGFRDVHASTGSNASREWTLLRRMTTQSTNGVHYLSADSVHAVSVSRGSMTCMKWDAAGRFVLLGSKLCPDFYLILACNHSK